MMKIFLKIFVFEHSSFCLFVKVKELDPLPAMPYFPYRLSSTVLRCATEGELADACY